MKMSFFIFLLSLSLLLSTSIWAQETPSRDTEEFLIEQLAQHDLVKASIEDNGELIIATRGLCETNDCDSYFSKAKVPLSLFDDEQIFQRGIITYVVIKEMELDQEVPTLVAELVLRSKSIAIVIRKE